MTNFEYIKQMNIKELANYLGNLSWEDASEAFCLKFCDKCSAIKCSENGREQEYFPCELNEQCPYVIDGLLLEEDFHNGILWWLKQERK